jgi:hypothetical protein
VLITGCAALSCGGISETQPGSERGGAGSGGQAAGQVSSGGQTSSGGQSPSESCFELSVAVDAADLANRVERKLGVALQPAMLELLEGPPRVRARRLTDAIDSALRASSPPSLASQILHDFVVDRLLAENDPDTGERRVAPYPREMPPDLGADMDEEFERAIAHWLSDGEGSLEHLFTDNTAFLTPALARHYGLPAPEGDDFIPVPQPEETQMGLVTRGAFLARQPRPPDRAVLLFESLSCQVMVPPPGITSSVWDAPDRLPTKQFVELGYGQDQVTCAACHDVYIGYSIALDRYDALGRYREQHDGSPIDTSFRLAVGPSGGKSYVEFDGPEELGRALGKAPSVRRCLIEVLVQRLGMAALSGEELGCVMSEFGARGASLSALLAILTPRWLGLE